MFEIKNEQFQGPLAKLLELIEARQLEVTRIALADVTADFLDYIKTLENIGADVLADFVVVASRLVLIKSKVLLPSLPLTDVEERDIHDLESRLALYREFRAAGAVFAKNFSETPQSASRQFLFGTPPIFYPSQELRVDTLRAAIGRVFAVLEEFIPKDERVVKRALVTIEEKMKELIARLGEMATQSFRSLSTQKSKSEVVALFLAVLHLVRHHGINVEQQDQFADIIIRK
ncbi:MAG: segregation/condensation protein A [bacterium]|nr:segregation/condensation protein A [bacterium]